MLVLSRKVDEGIHIGGGVVLTVIRVGRSKVRLGVEAPRSLTVVRGESRPAPAAPLVPPRGSPPALKPGVRR
jgi:carbon storage regulator